MREHPEIILGSRKNSYGYRITTDSLPFNVEIHSSIRYKSARMIAYQQGFRANLQNAAKHCTSSSFTASSSFLNLYRPQIQLQLGAERSVTAALNLALLSAHAAPEYACHEPRSDGSPKSSTLLNYTHFVLHALPVGRKVAPSTVSREEVQFPSLTNPS